MKIYIHHYYTYELFWYFFHATQTDKKIPTWFDSNRYNKNNKVDEDAIIDFKYQDLTFQAIFCNNRYWDNSDGYHLWDYTIYHIENKNIGDRGWNVILGKDLEHDIIPKINNYSKKLKDKISLFFIDWEFGSPQQSYVIEKKLNKNVTIFKDELINISDAQKVSFTHILWSFIFPNTIKLREYYFLADYLKYKKDYKYRINYPVRRITTGKYNTIKKIHSFNNPYFNCTVSSFTNYYKHDRTEDKDVYLYDSLNKIGIQNLINKRGYNIEDFGGEWNDNNMNEFMWKLLTVSEINFINEVSSGHSINEKSFSHILANKPFIPTMEGTFDFYNEVFKTYGYPQIESPTKGLKRNEKLNFLNDVSSDDEKWNEFYNKVEKFINTLRNQILEIMNTRNGYLDYLIKKENEQKDII